MAIKKYYQAIIKIPQGVNVTKNKNILTFSGPLGITKLNLQKIDPMGIASIFLDIQNNNLKIRTLSKSFFGLFKSILENKLQGVSRGFLVYLRIVGIGYRANIENKTLFLKLGYSHDILYKIPESVRIFLLEPTLLCLFGIDKNQITQVAAKIRQLRKPSVYKGKGIRLLNEKITLKAGKRK